MVEYLSQSRENFRIKSGIVLYQIIITLTFFTTCLANFAWSSNKHAHTFTFIILVGFFVSEGFSCVLYNYFLNCKFYSKRQKEAENLKARMSTAVDQDWYCICRKFEQILLLCSFVNTWTLSQTDKVELYSSDKNCIIPWNK